MKSDQKRISYRPLRTPWAAAIAGIIFAILQLASFVLLQVSVPADSFIQYDWLTDQYNYIAFAIGLMPFAGIAFLWFIGVLRDLIGQLEDKFFSTLFFGSGLLYLAMSFTTAAIVGGILTMYEIDPDLIINAGFYLFARAMIYKFINVFAIRMAGMFMLVMGTIWVRTRLMPRWMVISTYLIAIVLLIGISFWPWITLLFPFWVFVISAYVLVLNYRYKQNQVEVNFEGQI